MKITHFLCTFLTLVSLASDILADDKLNESIARGEYLARVSNCVTCHTIKEGKPFAGGLKMATPIGNIYATNITPDKETGIGEYTLEEFGESMRLGIRKDGERLYPAMPYPSYTKIKDEDIKDLYNYFMFGVEPVVEKNKPSEIPWILSFRWPIMIWNAFFFSDEYYQEDISQDENWNRGAYLVQGMGHCGACHTPRGIAWNEKAFNQNSKKYLSGAFLDNWFASDLTQSNRSGLGRWTKEEIKTYLKDGRNIHSTAFGTMDEVIINSTQYMNDNDLNAMATYLKSLEPANTETKYEYDDTNLKKLRSIATEKSSGEILYIQNCGACHLYSGKGYPPYIPPLAGNPTSMDPDPSSLINIVLNGSSRLLIDNTPEAYRMPGYRKILNNQEIAEIISFMRKEWGNNASAVTKKEIENLKLYTYQAEDIMPVLKMK